jgi:TolA-binding protein
LANDDLTVVQSNDAPLDAMIRKKLDELGREIREFKVEFQEYQTKVRKTLLDNEDATDDDEYQRQIDGE